MAEKVSIICINIYLTYSLSIHLLMGIGGFHVLATINSAAMNTGVCVSFQLQFSSFLDICTGVGLLDHMVLLFLVL